MCIRDSSTCESSAGSCMSTECSSSSKIRAMPLSISPSSRRSIWTHDCLGAISLSPHPQPSAIWLWLKGLSWSSAVATPAPSSSPGLVEPETSASGSAGMKKHPVLMALETSAKRRHGDQGLAAVTWEL
eukprot:7949204-Heterocapsa_arctica.AAC.1